MKRFFFLIVTAFLIVGTNLDLSAQKNVNVDNLRFSYKIRNLPSTPLEPRSFYYGSSLVLPLTIKTFIDEVSLADKLNIEGQRFTAEPKDGDVMVNISMEPITIENSTVRDRYVESKSKDGRVSRTYYYWVEVSYSFAAKVVVMRGSKQIYEYAPVTRNQTYTFKSGEYDTGRAASGYWRDNKDMLREQFTRERTDQVMDLTSSRLSDLYGFRVVSEGALIKTINEKKHPENEALRAMSQSIENKVKALDGTTPLTEADMADEIEYFKNIPVRYTDPKLKADVRLRYVAYYNLCRIYIYLDQPEKVREWADLLTQNGHDKKDGERLIDDAQKIIDRFNASDIKTRQFNPDTFFSK